MPRNFSRHEQFLRIFALLEILSNSRQPLDDQSLITQLKERLGLSRLSTRTLHRDCDFLISCGYPIDHMPLPGIRRYGWQMTKDAAAGRTGDLAERWAEIAAVSAPEEPVDDEDVAAGDDVPDWLLAAVTLEQARTIQEN